MRESRTYGSVRGALSNGRPYRVRLAPLPLWVKSGPRAPSALSPVYPQLRTSSRRIGMSLSCHKRTFRALSAHCEFVVEAPYRDMPV
jgi:hypothetical protein